MTPRQGAQGGTAWSLGCGVWGLGSRVWGLGCGVQVVGFAVWSLGCGVDGQGYWFRVWDLGMSSIEGERVLGGTISGPAI